MIRACIIMLAAFCAALLPAQTIRSGDAGTLSAGVRLTLTRANAPPGSCGCFQLVGGAADAALPLTRGLSLAFDLAGNHTSDVPATHSPISTIVLTAGPRYTLSTFPRQHAFVQVLAGAARGFDGQFGPSATPASATGFALLLGGGYLIQLTRQLDVRAVELDYQQTGLPNGSDNRQRNLRLATGITVRFKLPQR